MKSVFRTAARRGFTLIELIITIVIIGVLAAVAIPKFQSLSNEANDSVVKGVAAAIASATSVNYAKRKANIALGVALATCGDVETNIATLADVPAGTTVTVAATALATDGTGTSCTVNLNGSSTAVTLYGTV